MSCSKKEINTFNDLVYQAFKKYAEKEKLLDFSNLEVLEFDSLLFDESHEDGSNDYIVAIHYVCKENRECFKPLKNVEDKNHYQLYLTLDRMNDVVNVFSFKTSGLYYESLKEKYGQEVLQYLVEHHLAFKENVRLFKVDLLNN